MNTDKANPTQLFYSVSEQDRQAAFVLAKELDCYDSFINDTHALLSELPSFHWCAEIVTEAYEDNDQPPPTGIQLKRECIENFADNSFYPDLELSGRHADDEEKLSSIPQVVFNFSFLETLDLSWNNIEQIPEAIGALTHLKSLDLSANGLSSLPESMASLTALETLTLYGNSQIFSPSDEIPASWKALTNLKHFSAQDVYLTRLPDWIDSWATLETLFIGSAMGSCPDLEIPASLVNLQHLQALSISDYHIDMPPGLERLTSLQSLCLTNLTQAEPAIRQLTNLTELDLSYFHATYAVSLGHETTSSASANANAMTITDVPEERLNESKLRIYNLQWLKEMTWLDTFTFEQIDAYALSPTDLDELQTALPNCEIRT